MTTKSKGTAKINPNPNAKIKSIAKALVDALEDVEHSRLTDTIVIEAASECLRTLNLSTTELVDDVFQPAWSAYTFDTLAEIANNHHVFVETEVYEKIENLFYAVRNGTADLDAFFADVLGKNL